jgi:hypothetical protein
LKTFSEQLAASGIPQNDPRALKAWAQVQDHCERGDTASAKAELEAVLKELGVAPALPEPSAKSQAEGLEG